MIAQVDQPWLPTGADKTRQQLNNEPGSLVSMLIEVQPDGSQLLLKGDDRVYQEMIKRLEACEAEEIIIGNQRATYEGTMMKVQEMSFSMWKMVHTRHCLLRKYTTI